jgi:hypothetical protein
MVVEHSLLLPVAEAIGTSCHDPLHRLPTAFGMMRAQPL